MVGVVAQRDQNFALALILSAPSGPHGASVRTLSPTLGARTLRLEEERRKCSDAWVSSAGARGCCVGSQRRDRTMAEAQSPQVLSQLIGSIYDCVLDPSR